MRYKKRYGKKSFKKGKKSKKYKTYKVARGGIRM